MTNDTTTTPTPTNLLGRLDRWFAWGGEWLNPIVVKEARQALKSRQFAITFALLLVCAWGWSLLGMTSAGPAARYAAMGGTMFGGYYVILSFPLLIIVPFTAFRSIAVEQEDRTYELLSITTLRPTQIVAGKLVSAFLQILLYMSAISPCLAFTYMLRGLSAPTILLMLGYITLLSAGLSMLALLLGTLTERRHAQVVLSVMVVLALAFVFLINLPMTFEVGLAEETGLNEPEFWPVLLAVLTAYISYFVLVFHAAASRITFASDNRSTRPRVVALVQHLLLIGWIAWFLVSGLAGGDVDEAIITLCLWMGLHWYVIGTLMTGESTEFSYRVRRSLPQSFLGRTLFTWFNPGPGTGYMLVVCACMYSLVIVILFGITGGWMRASGLWNIRNFHDELAFGVACCLYPIVLLGMGLLIMRLMRRWGLSNMFTALLIQVILLAIGMIGPISLSAAFGGWNAHYNLLHITNPFWTLAELVDGTPQAGPVLMVLVIAAAILFLANVPGVAREVRHVRIAAPKRVTEDSEETLNPHLAPPKTSHG